MAKKNMTRRPPVVIEHPEGFHPWDNNPALIRLMAEAVVASVGRQQEAAYKAARAHDHDRQPETKG
jgi:hypothetical protein